MAAAVYQYKVKLRRRLLTGTPDQVLETHDSLCRLNDKVGDAIGVFTEENKVAFDLAKVPDIDPGGVLLMMHAGYPLSSLGWRPYAIDPTGNSIAFRKVSKNFQHLRLSPADRQNFPTNEGEYPLRAVFDRNSMVSELEDWANTVRGGARVSPESVALWGVQISEVVTNSFQHGPDDPNTGTYPPIYLAGGVHEGSVQLAALDRGRGIPRTIEQVCSQNVLAKGDGALIAEACRRGVTSHSTRQNQGAGLPDLLESVRSNGGTLTIFSQRGFLHMNAKGTIHARNLQGSARGIAGTFTIVSLRV